MRGASYPLCLNVAAIVPENKALLGVGADNNRRGDWRGARQLALPPRRGRVAVRGERGHRQAEADRRRELSLDKAAAGAFAAEGDGSNLLLQTVERVNHQRC